MNKTILKILIIIIVLCGTRLLSNAQDNFAQYDIGAAGSFNSVKSDALTAKSTISPQITFNFNQTPFLNYVLEVQAGKLEGGDSTRDKLGLQFSNSFTAFYFRIQLQMGEIIDYSNSAAANAFKICTFPVVSGILLTTSKQIVFR